MRAFAKIPLVSVLLVLVPFLTWFVVAHRLHLDPFQSQKSSLLMQVGAVNGIALERGEAWRLITSQFLHVHFLHMLGNMLGVYVIASAIERRLGHSALALIYLLGGSVGQYFSVQLRPELVTSGASQALMAICGFTLLAYRHLALHRRTIRIGATIVAFQIALDVYVSGSVKPGHSFGLIAGMVAVLILTGVNSFKRSES